MSPRSSSNDQTPAASSRNARRQAGERASKSTQTGTTIPQGDEQSVRTGSAAPEAEGVEEPDVAGQLNFRDAQTALELSLAALQAADLDVEEMAGLYRRASRYADRCEQLLQQVEQEVMQWDPAQPMDTPQPYQA